MHNRRVGLAAVIALLLGACSGDAGTGPTPPTQTPPTQNPPQPVKPTASASVEAGANSNVFTPATVDITAGGTVTWTFGARAHDVNFAGTSGAPADVPVTTNAQVARTFNTKGSFGYDCTLHSGMVGTVRVH